MTKDRKTMEIKRAPTLFKRSPALIQQRQKQLDGPLVAYWHGTNGSACQNDEAGFHEALKQVGPTERLYLFGQFAVDPPVPGDPGVPHDRRGEGPAHLRHANKILNLLEGDGAQVLYPSDPDWHLRTEERRWIPMNDHSSWRRIWLHDGEPAKSVFHVR